MWGAPPSIDTPPPLPAGDMLPALVQLAREGAPPTTRTPAPLYASFPVTKHPATSGVPAATPIPDPSPPEIRHRTTAGAPAPPMDTPDTPPGLIARLPTNSLSATSAPPPSSASPAPVPKFVTLFSNVHDCTVGAPPVSIAPPPLPSSLELPLSTHPVTTGLPASLSSPPPVTCLFPDIVHSVTDASLRSRLSPAPDPKSPMPPLSVNSQPVIAGVLSSAWAPPPRLARLSRKAHRSITASPRLNSPPPSGASFRVNVHRRSVGAPPPRFAAPPPRPSAVFPVMVHDSIRGEAPTISTPPPSVVSPPRIVNPCTTVAC